jgi:pimeloyl-ACP methyl ester carboxylesterase
MPDLPLLFVHGSCHGAWCWRDVLAVCAARGIPASAIDLPSHGADPTPLREVTLDSYVTAILEAIRTPVHLVGHSAGGFPITAAAIAAPEKIRALTYVCAYLPETGKSLVEMRKAAAEQPLAGALDVAADGLSFRFAANRVRDLLYQDCSAEVLTFAAARLCPQAILPQRTALPDATVPAEVARHYILCENDHTIPPAHQRHMSRDLPPAHVHRMATGHSPFFADPEGLVDILTGIRSTLGECKQNLTP